MSKMEDFGKGFGFMFGGMVPPMFPPLPFMQKADGERKSFKNNVNAEEIKSSVKKFQGQMTDMRKSAKEGTKDKRNQFFDYLMEMQDSFIDALSDEAFAIPGVFFGYTFTVSPKEFLKQLKEFEEMVKDFFAEQAGSFEDFSGKSKEKIRGMVKASVQGSKVAADASAQEEESAEPEK